MLKIICLGAMLTVAGGSRLPRAMFTVTPAPRDVRHNTTVLQSACADMTPMHGRFQPTQTPAPYVIKVSKTSSSPGDTIQLIIYGHNSTDFRGVYLHGRHGDTPVGHFLPSGPNTPDITLSDCSPGTQNAASFISFDPINQLIFNYIVPAVPSIVFRATFVRTYAQFWTDVASENVTVTLI